MAASPWGVNGCRIGRHCDGEPYRYGFCRDCWEDPESGRWPEWWTERIEACIREMGRMIRSRAIDEANYMVREIRREPGGAVPLAARKRLWHYARKERRWGWNKDEERFFIREHKTA